MLAITNLPEIARLETPNNQLEILFRIILGVHPHQFDAFYAGVQTIRRNDIPKFLYEELYRQDLMGKLHADQIITHIDYVVWTRYIMKASLTKTNSEQINRDMLKRITFHFLAN